MEITELINHPERLDRDTLYELRSMLALDPYYQTARLLMLQNLYLLHDAAFDEELRRAALYVTDRKTIFNMIEAAHYQLRKQPTADSQKPAYLLETENDTTSEDAPQLKGHDLIDTFLQQEQGRIMLELPQEEHDDSQQDDSDDTDEEYFTETLARIYIKQGRYQKALDIITRLSGKYPHKNAYFADQIRFLEKLIINNKTRSSN